MIMSSNYIIIIGNNKEYSVLKRSLDDQIDIDSIYIKGEDVSILDVKKLILSNVKLQTINVLCRFVNTIYLNLSFNDLVDISSIMTIMLGLQILDVSHNKLVSVIGIHKLTNLQILRCHYNKLSSIEPLSFLYNLCELWISHNKLEWTELVFLSPLRNLKALAMEGNLIEQKDKYMDFARSLCPSIQCADGRTLTQLSANSGAAFLKSSLGRTMLVHARSAYPKNQRIKTILLDIQRIGIIQEQSVPIIDDQPNVQPRLGHIKIQESCAYTMQADNGIPLQVTVDKFEAKDAQECLHSTSISKPVPSQINEVPNTVCSNLSPNPTSMQVPPLKRDSPQLMSKLSSPKESSGMKTSRSEGTVGVGVAEKKPGTINRNAKPSHTTRKTRGQGSEPLEERVVVRFGDSAESPIALCIYSDGSGFMRWSRTGSMACTIECGRFLASYQGGAAAVVVDCLHGSGTVVDPRGNCVLSLSPSGTATEMGLNKKWLASYKRRAGKSTAVTTGEADVQERSWKFEGIEILFKPATWEIAVRINSTRLCCEFSSVRGGRVLEEFNEEKDELPKIVQGPDHSESESQRQSEVCMQTVSQAHTSKSTKARVSAAKSAPKKKTESSVQRKGSASASASGNSEPTSTKTIGNHEVDHTALRSDLSSMMTGLDEMLSGLRKR